MSAGAKAVGRLCLLSQTSDAVAASVVLVDRVRGDRVVTSDPDDIAKIDAGFEVVPL